MVTFVFYTLEIMYILLRKTNNFVIFLTISLLFRWTKYQQRPSRAFQYPLQFIQIGIIGNRNAKSHHI